MSSAENITLNKFGINSECIKLAKNGNSGHLTILAVCFSKLPVNNNS